MKAHSAILIVLLVTLTACSYFRKNDDNFKKCPTVGMVADAQGWSEPPSPTDWKARAQINEFDMKCKVSKTDVTVQITPKIAAERNGEATDSMKQELPFFIAAMKDDQIVQKNIESKTINFASHEKMAKDDFTLSIELPFNDEGTAADRSVFFGFQLNEDQLNYMRSLRDNRATEAEAATDPATTPAAPAPEAR